MKLTKLFGKTLSGSVTPTGTIGLVVNRGHTGRSTPVGVDYRLVEEWSKAGSREQLMSHQAANRFRTELNSVATVGGGSVECVRGRLDDGTIASWRDMGPPPPSCAVGGRYAPSGAVVLYLCDSAPAVFRELSPADNGRVFLQEYVLRTDSLRLADFTPARLDEFVKAVFDVAENSSLEGRVGPVGYTFSQVVGDLVRQAGFDGMVVPGVRGAPHFQYRNVVVFESQDRWLRWSRQETGFRSAMYVDGAV